MKEVCAEVGWCAEQLLLPSLLVMKILFQESVFPWQSPAYKQSEMDTQTACAGSCPFSFPHQAR